MSLVSIPSLADLVSHPTKVKDLPLEAVPNLRGELARLDTLLQMRVAMAQSNGRKSGQDGDQLLSAKITAARLGVCVDYVYKHTDEFPFAVNEGRRVLFSERGLEQYLQEKMKKKGLDI